jgi:signal transduction histidine kinase
MPSERLSTTNLHFAYGSRCAITDRSVSMVGGNPPCFESAMPLIGQAKLRILAGQTVLALLLLFAVAGDAIAAPKRVLILHSFAQDIPPWSEYSKYVRAELFRRLPHDIDLFEATLETARIPGDLDDGPFAEYLGALFRDHPLDLVISIAAPASRFFQRHRQRLFPNTPLLVTGLEQRLYVASGDANEAAVLSAIDFPAVIKNILQVLPATDRITIVLGASPLERYWKEQIGIAVEPFRGRVAFTWFNDLSFDEMLKQVAALPPNSAVFFVAMAVDAAGAPQNDGRVLSRLQAASTAPIFGFEDSYFGSGLVGGPMLSIPDISRRVVDAVVRIFAGEKAASIQASAVGFVSPKFDWRELQRWNIEETNLPAASTVEFREPTFWGEHRKTVITVVSILFLQAILISALLFERVRRRRAEAASQRRLFEMTQMNRSLTISAMSSSIAHELNQPLGAILNNAGAAEVLLAKNPPDIDQLREIMTDIRKDDERAGEIIGHLRGFLRTDERSLSDVSINRAIADVLHIVEPEAAKRGIAIDYDRGPPELSVRADHVHLQQVLLNLALNGMDAMSAATPNRRMVFQASRVADAKVEVAVLDTGTGIPAHRLKEIFDSFVTTKQHGTGLGLSIARTIVEMYGGKIWAENRQHGGAAFRFVLPLVKSAA